MGGITFYSLNVCESFGVLGILLGSEKEKNKVVAKSMVEVEC